MQILVVNDDGIEATGIEILSSVAATFGEVLVVAPDREMSACSHAITLDRPLRAKARGESRFAVDGTPTDCVYLGLHHLSKAPVDLLLSGINHGPNLGGDVFYSGTVAGAMEGARAGVPSIAFSLAVRQPTRAQWRAAHQAVEVVLRWFLAQPPMPSGSLLNVNLPPTLSEEEVPPLCVTRLGKVDYPPSVEARVDPKGRQYYWIGGGAGGPSYGESVETDCGAILDGRVSLSPLRLDITDQTLLTMLASRLKCHDPIRPKR